MASYQTVKTGKEHCLSYHMFDFFFHLLSEHLFFFSSFLFLFFFFSHRIWSVFSCVNHALCTRKGEWSPLREDKKKKKKKARSRGTDGSREGANLFERLLHRLESIGVRAIGRYVLFVTWYALFVQMWPAGSSLGPTVSPSVVWSTAGAVVFI